VRLNGIKYIEAKKVRMQKSRLKIMLTAFFDAKGIIHLEFVPENQTVNGKFHKEVIKKSVARAHRVRPEYLAKWVLISSARQYMGAFFGLFSEFLAKRGISVLSHPPYSPHLTPVDFSLFLKLKTAMKGTRFEAVSSTQHTVTRELNAILEEAFSRAFDSLYERCKFSAEAGGEYIEQC
jgi:histone-lysine N-methyltransferase SETMAR